MKRDSDLAPLRGHPALRGLLGRGRGAPAPALPAALPDTVDEAFALLARSGITLPRPSTRGGTNEALPASLSAFYARAARLPTTSNDSIVSLGSRKAAAKRFAKELEEETAEVEGLQRSEFSATSRLVVLGSSDNGGTYVLDPDRWGEIVFELAHDETGFVRRPRPSAPSSHAKPSASGPSTRGSTTRSTRCRRRGAAPRSRVSGS